MLTYQCVPTGTLEANSYILRDEATGALALIDCGVFSEQLREALAEAGGDLRYILLTHGHFDHVRGAPAAKEAFPKAQVAIGAGDVPLLRGEKADVLLQGSEEFSLGESLLQAIAVPGHSPGGLCFLSEQRLFTGDTLFREDVGRTDLPGGDWTTLCASIQRLYALPGDYEVLPGHGPSSHLEHERRHNAYVRMDQK